MKKQRGITLVALVITIIIIIILATVAINFLFGENGLITRAQQAAQMSDIENVREKLEMAKGTAVIDGRGYIDPDHYFDIIYEEGIIGDRENDVTDNGNGTYEITTTEGYIFIITLLPTPEEAKDIDIEYSGTSEGPRIVSIKADGTTNSISIEVEARNAERATYTYEYSISGEEKWQEAEQSKNNTCTINNLTEGETYDIRVTVTTNDGSVTRKTSVHLGELPEGTITFKSEWVGDGTARVTINTSAEGYRLQYQINAVEENGWIDIDNGVTVSNLTYPSTVYARIFDGTNGSEEASETLEDKTAPQVTVTPNGTTSNSVSVSAAATDAQSGMKDSLTYTYSIKVTGQDDSAYTTPSNANDITANSYTFTGLTQGTNYTVRVQVNGDKANNIGTGTLADQTTGTVGGATGGLTTGNIVASNPTWINGQASITLTTSTGLQIQYQTNSTTGQWTTISSGGQVTGLNHNDTVYARLTDGNNYGDYASVTIKDGTPPTISNITPSNITYNSVTVTVTASDGQSGLATNGTYKYYLNSETTPRETNTTGSYTFTGLNAETGYTIKVVVTDKAGNEAEGTTTATTVKQLATNVNELKAGDYVYYTDGKGTRRTCVVLYDSSSSYGVEIITMESVEDVELGNGTGSSQTNNTTYFNTAMNSYNNAIETLNDATAPYNNSTYSSRARCVGSDPSNPTSDSPGYFTSSYSYMASYNGQFKKQDTHYETDYDQMGTLGVRDIDVFYWLASRNVLSSSSFSHFSVRNVNFQRRLGHQLLVPCVCRCLSEVDLHYAWPPSSISSKI